MGTNQTNKGNNEIEENFKFTVQFFGQNEHINIYHTKKMSLKELNYIIAKLFNLKKIECDRIMLFYRETNRLNYTRIDSNNLENIINSNNNIIIKVKISPEFSPKSKKEDELSKIYSDHKS